MYANIDAGGALLAKGSDRRRCDCLARCGAAGRARRQLQVPIPVGDRTARGRGGLPACEPGGACSRSTRSRWPATGNALSVHRQEERRDRRRGRWRPSCAPISRPTVAAVRLRARPGVAVSRASPARRGVGSHPGLHNKLRSQLREYFPASLQASPTSATASCARRRAPSWPPHPPSRTPPGSPAPAGRPVEEGRPKARILPTADWPPATLCVRAPADAPACPGRAGPGSSSLALFGGAPWPANPRTTPTNWRQGHDEAFVPATPPRAAHHSLPRSGPLVASRALARALRRPHPFAYARP